MPGDLVWKHADAYNYLDDLGSIAFAWEFLRRNAAYQAACQLIAGNIDAPPEMSEQVAQQWGLQFLADPGLRADRARVIWLPHLNPSTVVVAQAPDEFTEARPIKLTPDFSCRSADGEHWLIDRGGDPLPVALIDGADASQPAAVVIPLDDSFPTRIEAVRRLFDTMANDFPGRISDSLTAQQRSRLGLILRALDGCLVGCSYREIAEVLFGPNSVPAGRAWTNHDLRSRTIRLCRRGLDLVNGGYLNLLRYPRQALA
jgi:hypothetical protein